MAETPSWLNENLIRSTLEREFGGQIKIVNFCTDYAAPPGSNYMSQTLRVKVKFVAGEDSSPIQSTGLVVKVPFTTGFPKELSDKVDFYSKEPNVYKDLFPKMFLKLKEELSPKSYYCPINGGLILKDLKDDGYVMMDRCTQLDFSHCKEVFVAIAKFHASSVAYHHEDPNLVESLGKEIFYTETGPVGTSMKGMLENSFKSIAEVTEELGCDRFSNLLFSKVDSIFETATQFYRAQPKKLNVLVHGDLWTTNVLFKHNQSAQIIDVKLIDYQLTRYMSPVLDLLFFIWTSANEEVREHHQENLYEVYLQTLNFHLKNLGCTERLSAEELKIEIKSSSDLALMQICSFLPYFVAPPEDYIPLGDVDIKEFESSSTYQYQKLFRGKLLVSMLPTLARQFMHYFDL